MKRLLLSLPLIFTCAAQSLRADAVVTFNEVMYHPSTNEAALEWVELRNLLAVDVDLSDWSITGAINYTFASNTIIRGRSQLVVSISPSALQASTGLSGVLGPFTGRLGNNGETLRLRNNSGRVVDEVTYGVEDDWPVAPDGSGASLAKRDPDSASAPAHNWVASEQPGGTPGNSNFPDPNLPQPDVQVLDVTGSWKYEASGADLGTAWREPGYSDAAWAVRSNLALLAIADLYNTGVGDNRQALAAGANDPHYILSSGAQGTAGAAALVIQNHPAWLANDSTSSFISVVNPGSTTIAGGGYDFRTTFSLSGMILGTVRVNMDVAVDNTLSDVVINGSGSGLTTSGFAAFNPTLTLSSGFVAGLNTLEFRTVNEGAGPGGFRALVSGTGLGANTNPALPVGRSTYYFRRSFPFSGDPAFTRLRINPILADGAVIYLNGTEVFRQNLPAGPINYATPALSNVASPNYGGLVEIPAASLIAGVNVLAVEIHQAAASSDEPLLGLDMISTQLPSSGAGAASLAFSEVSSATNSPFFVEIQNHGSTPIALADFTLHHDGAVDHAYNFPATMLAPGAFLAVTAQTLGFTPVSGDKFYLSQNASGRVLDAIVVKNRGRARFPQITSPWAFPSAPTPGAANTVTLRTEIVINEIMHSHALLARTNDLPPVASPEEWIELHNRSASPVDLGGWQLAGGISYLFTPGQTIPAGGYLVVADDVPYLRALHPGITIVGDYGGRLGGSDRVVLKDPTGNVADEVQYYGGMNWPRYASSGGSSLELRDPGSDNSKAEAWDASDETGKTTWQNYSYRMVASIPSGSGQPTTWQDFILGLQSSGECLIDDLSVIENPATTPVEIISNGDFESGLSGWRVLGTHNQSRVQPEPGNPGNNVLRVVATGAQEHMHNHIERTLNSGRTIVNNREYQISYRARWLAGNNLVNTRLYFNRSARTTVLPMPLLNGTPGAQNSRYEANVGPTFSGLSHERVVPQPGEPVTVNVIAEDPQNVASCHVFWSVNSGAWANAAMTHQGGGAYTGTIPGQAVGAVVQFYVRAVDGLGAAATYPARGTNSGALYKVNDGQADLNLAHNVRLILSPANIDLLHGTAQGVNQTNVMSNDLLPCTVIYNESRAYYDCAVHLRGSQRGRYRDVRTGYHINFPPDDLFRGVNPVMLVDRSGAGDTEANRQEEVLIKHILNRAGNIPGNYTEIARLLAPRSIHNGPIQFFPRHEDAFIESAFENGNDGQMFEMELIYFPTTANAAGYKNPQPDSVIGTDITDLGDDKEIYRYNFMLKNHRDEDDYSRFIALAKAWSLTGTQLDAQTRQLMDIDQWMRAYSIVSLCGVGDTYTFGNNHNFFTYSRPSDGKFVFFPWDMDFSFNRGTSDALVGNQNLGKIVNLPGNLRVLYAHMLDIINVSFNSGYMADWVAHYQSFAPGQNYAPRVSYIQTRANFARNTINTQTGTNFIVTTSSPITTSDNLVTLTGTAAASVKTIKINGAEYPVTWTSVSAWRIQVPVTEASTVLNITTEDVRGNPIANFNRTVTVNYTGPTPDPTDAIVINEIMYNPAAPNAGYIELYNRSSTLSFDLSGWRINGADYTFPKGGLIAAGQYLVIAANSAAYFAAYGNSAPAPFGVFNGNLQNDGETLTLLRPGAAPGQEIVMDKVRYESAPAWPTAPNGTGPSLQLIDASQDNSRAANWSDGAGWSFFSYTRPVGSSQLTNLAFFFQRSNLPGDVYLDDISLVIGDTPAVGENVLANAGFEEPFAPAWRIGDLAVNSVITTDVAHSGASSAHIIFTPGSLSLNNFAQSFPSLTPDTNYTLSFWYLGGSSGTNLSFRLNSIFTSFVDPRPTLFTPGAPNSSAAPLPPYPALWLNEVQAQNIEGITDNQGEREPWIELHNSGTTPVSLAGYYLVNNYSNLTQWAFPAGAMLQPGEFKVVFADGEPGESTANEWHTSFRLNAGQGSAVLAWTPSGAVQVLDYMNYTNLTAGRSYGAYPDGQPFERHEFYRVTAGGTNDNTAPPIVVYINEWMAANTSGLLNTNNGNRFDDWIELYNPGNTPANLAGYYLTDNLANKTQFLIPAGYVIPPQGYLLVWADGEPGLNTATDPALHVSFRLSQDGEAIGLFASDGTAIDTADFSTEPQFNNISQGRFPDGPSATYFLATPTPLGPNSSWANRYPVLAGIADANLLTGETLAFNAVASDPDVPAQTLTYSLNGSAPTGAVINANSGAFSWTPSASQIPSTNVLTVRVTDGGVPALTASRSFTVIITEGFRVSGIGIQPNGDLQFSVGATIGKTYRVEFKNDLNEASWSPLGANRVATSSTLVINDVIGTNPQRIYRVLQLD